MYFDRKNKILVLCPLKTGSSALRRTLLRRGFEIGHNHHGDVPSFHVHNPGVLDSSWMVICTVRSHWDVFVSMYHNRGERIPFGKEAIIRIMRMRGWFVAENSYYGKWAPWCDYTVPYPDVLTWLRLLFDDPELVHETYNDTKAKRPIEEYYDEKLIRWVQKTFGWEMELYGLPTEPNGEYGSVYRRDEVGEPDGDEGRPHHGVDAEAPGAL